MVSLPCLDVAAFAGLIWHSFIRLEFVLVVSDVCFYCRWVGLQIVQPNQSAVLTFSGDMWGVYVKQVWFTIPFCGKSTLRAPISYRKSRSMM